MKKYLEENGKMFVDGKEVKFVEDPVIYVPDEIEFEKYPEMLGMKFDKNSSLAFLKGNGLHVSRFCEFNKTKCKLTPCKWEDLEIGDWGFRHDTPNPLVFNTKILYMLKVSDFKYRYIDMYENIILSQPEFKYYWKVEGV